MQSTRRNIQSGMTLMELLLASSIMAMTVAAVASLGSATQSAASYSNGHNEVVEQARMISARIRRTVEEATASDEFPGFIVISTTVDGNQYPDALVVWHPDGAAVDPNGLPRVDELVIYAPHPAFPNTLVEITMPGYTQVVPAVTDTTAWQTGLLTAQLGTNGKQVVLTRQLRICTTTGEVLPDVYSPKRRGAIRFESRLRPSEDEWTKLLDGNLDWNHMAWVQDIHSAETGLRQAWLRFEMQLLPKDVVGEVPVPFYGSAALYYEMKRP